MDPASGQADTQPVAEQVGGSGVLEEWEMSRCRVRVTDENQTIVQSQLKWAGNTVLSHAAGSGLSVRWHAYLHSLAHLVACTKPSVVVSRKLTGFVDLPPD